MGTFGFTLVEIMIVVAIIGLLASIAIPNFVRARDTAQTNACINNLRQIDGAKQMWAMEMRQSGGVTPQKTDIDPYLGRAGNANNIVCPAGGMNATFEGSYSINAVTNAPTCEINPNGKHVLQ
jgi:prepilin-type N-terminal cleavage/methylation domain-containing protein